MKLLMISSHFQPAWDWGGPVRSTWNLTRGLANLGVDVNVLATNARQNGVVEVPLKREEEGVNIFTSPVFRDGKWKRFNRLNISIDHWKRIVKCTSKADIVHINGVWGVVPTLGTAACGLSQKPCVMSARGNLERSSLEQKASKKQVALCLGGRKVIESVSAIHYSTVKECDSSPSWVADIDSFVVPNPVEIMPMADGEQTRKRFGVDEKTLLLGAVGRIHVQKGLDIVVQALARSGKSNATKLLIVGPDEGFARELRSIAENQGVSDRIVFAGELHGERLSESYAAFDLLVLPSHHESFGNVIVEAAAQGTPCLISDQVGLRDWVEENDVGYVLSLDVNAWASAIQNLKKEYIKRRWNPDRLSAIAQESFSIETVARQMLEHYERIIKATERAV